MHIADVMIYIIIYSSHTSKLVVCDGGVRQTVRVSEFLCARSVSHGWTFRLDMVWA
jgi:hypothetical protein